MTTAEIYEIIGYAGSLLVAVSLTMKSILKLRIYNLIGALLFTVYGILIGAYPVLAVNGFITIVNIYYLIDLFNTHEKFDLIEIISKNDGLLQKFVETYNEDIRKFFPKFNSGLLSELKCIMIFRNLIPTGFLLYKLTEPNTAFIEVDYVTPDYRDLKNGKFLFINESDFFKTNGIKKVITQSYHSSHKKYLLNVGFVENNGAYSLEIT
ncbi:MAG: YgjV family protein [Melioribacteraceae bacterium]|nr:YgjV family protein [Melioribacteraceae bacterium]MCF8263001.1 YgjV family protein [Melioribacteraceae bacterium]MCF8413995.1 YgjV family protein [Melioribacteraceae bacterium]MCF8430446.1 YgjV family protein [Melioribacteraceae bacterium]